MDESHEGRRDLEPCTNSSRLEPEKTGKAIKQNNQITLYEHRSVLAGWEEGLHHPRHLGASYMCICQGKWKPQGKGALWEDHARASPLHIQKASGGWL